MNHDANAFLGWYCVCFTCKHVARQRREIPQLSVGISRMTPDRSEEGEGNEEGEEGGKDGRHTKLISFAVSSNGYAGDF